MYPKERKKRKRKRKKKKKKKKKKKEKKERREKKEVSDPRSTLKFGFPAVAFEGEIQFSKVTVKGGAVLLFDQQNVST